MVTRHCIVPHMLTYVGYSSDSLGWESVILVVLAERPHPKFSVLFSAKMGAALPPANTVILSFFHCRIWVYIFSTPNYFLFALFDSSFMILLIILCVFLSFLLFSFFNGIILSFFLSIYYIWWHKPYPWVPSKNLPCCSIIYFIFQGCIWV